MLVYSCVSLASPWSGALSDLRKKFLNSLSSGMCGSTKAPPLYTDLHDFSLRSSRPRVPISQVGSRGSRVFLRCSATATTSAASRTMATTGRLWRRERRNPSTAGPIFTCDKKFHFQYLQESGTKWYTLQKCTLTVFILGHITYKTSST